MLYYGKVRPKKGGKNMKTIKEIQTVDKSKEIANLFMIQFINLYRLLLLDRARSCINHSVHIYYDEAAQRLVTHMTNERETIYYNDFECSKEIGSYIADVLCTDFIQDHRITCSSFNKNNRSSVDQFKLRNSYFELCRNFDEKTEHEKLLAMHEQAIQKMNNYNSDPTNFERQVEEKEMLPTVDTIKTFTSLFRLLLLDRVKKAEQHDVSIYYDNRLQCLIIHITNNGETIYYNDFQCYHVLGSVIADMICQEFISDHRITLPCVDREESTFTIRNTYFTIKRKFQPYEKEQIEELRENAIQKMNQQNEELTPFEKKIGKMPSLNN